MKNLLKISCLFLLMFVLQNCNTPEKNEVEDKVVDLLEAHPRSCWWCISEDILGAAEGGFIGSAGGPIGVAVGAAVVGAYRSIRENNKNKPIIINDEDYEDFLTQLGENYITNYDHNPFDYVGKLHNTLLYSAMGSLSDSSSVEDYYDFMINIIKNENEFDNFIDSDEFKNAIMSAMISIENNEEIEIPMEYEILYEELKSNFYSMDEDQVLNGIEKNVTKFSDDQVALQTISVAYHTFYYWQKLSE